MEESIRVRKRGPNGFSEQVIHGVCCSETVGVQSDNVGFSGAGQMIVRIPALIKTELGCGDQICRVGSCTWYTIAEIRDNRRQGSGLSHRKIVGKR